MPPPPPPRSLHQASAALALLVVSLGCAHTDVSRAHTDVSRVWSDSALTEGRYERVMVLVIVPSEGRRETAEDRIVAELTRHGVTAVRSWKALPHEQIGDRERIREAVVADGADALLAVRLAAAETQREVSEGRQQWVPVGVGVDSFGYVSTAYGLYRKPEVSELRTFTIETTLWDVATSRMVWACQSDSTSADQTLTTAELADDYANVVMKKVRPYLRGR